MREIKFRAWDKERNMFVPDGEIAFVFYGDSYIDVRPNCLEYVGDSVHNGEPQRGRFIIEQFTNLLDADGKEIYEGDTDGAGNVVEFVNGLWCLNGDRRISSAFIVQGNIHDK